MLRYFEISPSSVPKGNNTPGQLLQYSAEEIDSFIDNVAQGLPGFYYTSGGALVNPDFSLLRIQDPAGDVIGSMLILHGETDAQGQISMARADRQAPLIGNDPQRIYGGYLDMAPTQPAASAGAGLVPQVARSVEHWSWSGGAWPDDFDVEIEAWGQHGLPDDNAVSDSLLATQFNDMAGQGDVDIVDGWEIITDGQVVGYLQRRNDGGQDWYFLGHGKLIPPSAAGRWQFRRLQNPVNATYGLLQTVSLSVL